MISFERIQDFLDLSILKKASVAIVGVGGMSEGVIDLCRSGIHNFIIIDPDIYEAPNLATQGGSVEDIGRYKVDVTKQRLEAINPQVDVIAIAKKYEELDKDDLQTVWQSNLVLMMTDNFDVQSLGNKHSVLYQKPTVFAASYLNQDAVEITWNAPGLTTHCHRCVTFSRYAAREEGFEQPSGAGSYVFTGRLLNAIIGNIALSMLHHYADSDYPIAKVIQSLGADNFLLTKILPDYGLSSGVFSNSTPFSTKSFSPDTPKDYVCPDCGVSGVV